MRTDNDEKLIKVISAINDISSSVGNEVLYKACDSGKLFEYNYLGGMMWLIGRSYAASPQRRSYGLSKRLVEKDSRKPRPVWRVKTENSGNGDFFSELEKNIREYSEGEEYKELVENIKKLQSVEYGFTQNDNNIPDEDIRNLALSIETVSMLNRLVKRGTEMFDDIERLEEHAHIIPDKYCKNDIAQGDRIDYVYCKNQISFSSKFLHFFCPSTVFIIDQFSREGGVTLFEKDCDAQKYVYMLSNALVDDTGDTVENGNEASGVVSVTLDSAFFQTINEKYNSIREQLIKTLTDSLKPEILKDAKEIKELAVTKMSAPKYLLSGDKEEKIIAYYVRNSFIGDYINHCANSYVLCMWLKEKFSSDMIIKKTYPRLSDTLFMRLKKTPKESSIHNDEDEYYFHEKQSTV